MTPVCISSVELKTLKLPSKETKNKGKQEKWWVGSNFITWPTRDIMVWPLPTPQLHLISSHSLPPPSLGLDTPAKSRSFRSSDGPSLLCSLNICSFLRLSSSVTSSASLTPAHPSSLSLEALLLPMEIHLRLKWGRTAWTACVTKATVWPCTALPRGTSAFEGPRTCGFANCLPL